MSQTVPTPAPRSPRTSVLVNNYNNGSFLRHCLDSVLGQSLAPDEVIVVDDGSTDESHKILAEYHGRIRVITREHGRGSPLENQADVIHAALKESTGELIFLLDGDDAFLPGKIDAYVKAYRSAENVVMVQAPLEKIDGRGRLIGYEYEPARHQEDYLQHIYSEHELNIYYPTSALAFHRGYLEQHLPLDFSDGRHIWPDARLALIAPHFGKVIALSRPYTQWRRHSRSHTVVKPFSVYRLVRENQRYFNAFCRATGRKTISPWRSYHHRRRWLRHYLIPDMFIHWFRVVRWATLDQAARERLQNGPGPAEIARELERLNSKGLRSREPARAR